MFRIRNFLIFFTIGCVSFVSAATPCNTSSLMESECGRNQKCVTSTTGNVIGFCECNSGYEPIDEFNCVPKKRNDNAPSSSSLVHDTKDSHLAVAIIVPLLLISIVICGVYVGYKYRVVSWVRNKINQRTTNYDEVMIGQDMDDDDPPLR